MPLVIMVNDVGGHGLEKYGEELQPSIMSHWELEKWKKFLNNSFKGTIWSTTFIHIAFGCGPSEGSLKEA